MKYLKLFSLLTVLTVFALVSCTDSTTNPIDTSKPDKITNLAATSLSDTSIALKWSVSASESDTSFNNYQVNILDESGTNLANSPFTEPKGTNILTIKGLNAGTVYTILIRGTFKNGNFSDSVYIKWSPAFRFTENSAGDDVLKLYEYASLKGSGLQLFDDVDFNQSATRTVSNSALWDLAFYFKTDKNLFGSADNLKSYFTSIVDAPGVTEIFNTTYEANSLDSVYDSQALNAGVRNSQYSSQNFDLNSLPQTSGVVFYVRKKNTDGSYNYAKVFIKKNPSSNGFIQGSGTDRYIEVQVSYQKTTGVPYAKLAAN